MAVVGIPLDIEFDDWAIRKGPEGQWTCPDNKWWGYSINAQSHRWMARGYTEFIPHYCQWVCSRCNYERTSWAPDEYPPYALISCNENLMRKVLK